MLVLMLATGGYFSIRTGFFQIRRFGLALKKTLFSAVRGRGEKQENGSVSAFQAMCSALAATLGTGNITGVATALATGGAGAVFWMWVSAVLGMMTGYAENVLGILFRKRDENGEWRGGAMRYIRAGLAEKKLTRPLAKPLSVLFAGLCLLCAFGMGNLAQMNSAAEALSANFGIPPLAVGIAAAVLAAPVIFGGVSRIGKFTEKLVPLMSGFYILGSVYILIANREQLPAMFAEIFRSAFGLSAVGGGICGYAVKKAVSMGIRRGVFSNEAGLGTSVSAHAASAEREPAVQGMWSIFEVFFDTIVMCSLSAFVLLASPNRAVPLSEALLSVSLDPQYVSISDEGLISGGVPFPTVGTGEPRRCLTVYGGEFSLPLGEGEPTFSSIAILRGIQSVDENGAALWLDAAQTRPLIEAAELVPVNGAALATYAFSQTFGGAAGKLLAAAVALFAFSTVVGWSCFGAQAAVFLFGKRAVTPFRGAFTAFILLGSCAELSLAWGISDTLNGLMALPNLFAVLCLSDKVIAVTKNYTARVIRGEDIPPILTAADLEQRARPAKRQSGWKPNQSTTKKNHAR